VAYTSADIDLLKTAIAAGRGVKSLTFGDQTIAFHSLQDMRDQLAAMEIEVRTAAGTRQSVRYAATSKGA
jgi:hypothetical protein